MKSSTTKHTSKVARLRCGKGLTQAALAKLAGVNIRTIQKIEAEERDIKGVSLDLALRIADALDVHPRELI